MRPRVLLSVCLALALAAPAAARAVPACAPLCETLASARFRPTMPDLAALERARDVSTALRAADPAVPVVAAPAPLGFAEELALLTQRLGVPMPESIPALPARFERALALVLAGAREAEAVRATALDPNDPRLARFADAKLFVPVSTDPRMPHGDDPELRALGASLDDDALRRAAALTAAGIDDAMRELAPMVATDHDCTGVPTLPNEIGGVIAFDLTGVPNRYEKFYALSIDLGGCDEYERVAGANTGVSIALDLGRDRDAYGNPPATYGLATGSQGIGALVDDGGDDDYEATGYAAMGGGMVGGIGLLADLGGSDRYVFAGSGGGFGAHGLGSLGLGVLIDLDGDDLYDYSFDPGEAPAGFSRLLGTQGAGVVGHGVLADARGNDVYTSYTEGNSVTTDAHGAGDFIASGRLIDASGDDRYLVDARPTRLDGGAGGGATGQGSGVIDGVGLLVEGGGNDSYALRASARGQTRASAAAIGQGFGLGVFYWVAGAGLVDLGGDDTYELTATAVADAGAETFATALGQGAGEYEGNGVLADATGDDRYEIAASGANAVAAGQGLGIGPALGVLVDGTGNDVYVAGPQSQGYGAQIDFGDGFAIPGGTGILVDGAGINDFSGPGRSSFFWQQGANGVGIGISPGGARTHALDLVGFVWSLFGMGRPYPVPTIAITSPAAGPVSGAIVVRGTADAAGIPVEAVQVRVDGGPWRLARKSGTWSSWSYDLGALAPGGHTIEARAWAAGVDSNPAVLNVVAE